MGETIVSKVKVAGKVVLTSDTGTRVETENPEILVIKKK